MKKNLFWFMAVGFALVLAAFPVTSRAEMDYPGGYPEKDKDKAQDEYKPKTIIKTYKGVRFDVPEDRPIRDYDGYIAPMPLDQYIYMKFEKMSQRLDAMEKKVNELKEKIRVSAPPTKS